jgi:hypothetical protein
VKRERKLITESGPTFFRAAKSEPRHGGAGALGLLTFTGGCSGMCSPLARQNVPRTPCRVHAPKGVRSAMGSRRPALPRAHCPLRPQISRVAAASTIPVTNNVAQANSRKSFRILVIAAPCVHGTFVRLP